MSKLNDSTLKIFKKYRLDTDMSVFGNENKLYDVVKVMDDMVGGQVSEYKAFSDYISSLSTEKIYSYSVNADSVFNVVEKTSTISSPDVLIIVDGLSYKVVSIFEKPSTICVGYLQGKTRILGYICYDIINKNFGVYSDISGMNSLTGTRCDEEFSAIPFILFSSSELLVGSSSSPYALTSSLVSNVIGNSRGYERGRIVTGDITLPEEIVNLLPEGYVGNTSLVYYLGVACTRKYTAVEV